jgi:hypothetical protein
MDTTKIVVTYSKGTFSCEIECSHVRQHTKNSIMLHGTNLNMAQMLDLFENGYISYFSTTKSVVIDLTEKIHVGFERR